MRGRCVTLLQDGAAERGCEVAAAQTAAEGRVPARPLWCAIFPISLHFILIFGLTDGGAGECKPQMTAFMECLVRHENNGRPCRDLSRAYLKCRMDRCARRIRDFNSATCIAAS